MTSREAQVNGLRTAMFHLCAAAERGTEEEAKRAIAEIPRVEEELKALGVESPREKYTAMFLGEPQRGTARRKKGRR